jgi:hypothetical protein
MAFFVDEGKAFFAFMRIAITGASEFIGQPGCPRVCNPENIYPGIGPPAEQTCFSPGSRAIFKNLPWQSLGNDTGQSGSDPSTVTRGILRFYLPYPERNPERDHPEVNQS